MDKKSIFITGAASGIGRETALLFARNGWFVGIFDLNGAGLEQLAKEIGRENCFGQVMDVTQIDSVRAGIDAFAQKTGQSLNVLLNNAGILEFGLFEKVSLESHHRIIDVNIKGCVNCIYFALPYLKNTPDARIINISSTSSNYGAPDLAVYSATKHALSAITEALDIELEKKGIIVCDIKPPYVKTPMLESENEIHSLKTMGIHVQPQEVAGKVWEAAHGKRLHWKVRSTPLLSFLFWLMPFLRRPAVKKASLPNA